MLLLFHMKSLVFACQAKYQQNYNLLTKFSAALGMTISSPSASVDGSDVDASLLPLRTACRGSKRESLELVVSLKFTTAPVITQLLACSIVNEATPWTVECNEMEDQFSEGKSCVDIPGVVPTGIFAFVSAFASTLTTRSAMTATSIFATCCFLLLEAFALRARLISLLQQYHDTPLEDNHVETVNKIYTKYLPLSIILALWSPLSPSSRDWSTNDAYTSKRDRVANEGNNDDPDTK